MYGNVINIYLCRDTFCSSRTLGPLFESSRYLKLCRLCDKNVEIPGYTYYCSKSGVKSV